MSNKEIVRDLLEKLPDEVSLLDIAREVEFLDGVRVGLDEADRGEFVNADKLRAQVRQWAHSK